jgi:hypothetical protein
MNIGELREKLRTLYQGNVGAVAYFILKIEDQLCIRTVDIKNEFLDDLRDCYLRSITNSILNTDDTNVGNLQLINISVADQRKDALYEYDLEAIPMELSFLENITINGEQQIFSSDVDSLSNLYGYVIAIGNGQSKVLLFRKHYPVSEFSPEKNFFIFESDHRFVKLEKDMIRLDHKIDIFYVDGTIIVKNLNLLESFLGFHDIIKREATASVQAIIAAGIVDNPETLSEMIEDISFARKLTKTAINSPVLGKIPTVSIIQFAKTHPALKKKIRFSADESKLHLHTKESKKLFLKLLNDDYLRSELTRAYYDSLAKDAMQVEE